MVSGRYLVRISEAAFMQMSQFRIGIRLFFSFRAAVRPAISEKSLIVQGNSVMMSAAWRGSTMRWVGCPCASNSQ